MNALRVKTLASLTMLAVSLLYRDRVVAQTNGFECAAMCFAGCAGIKPGCKKISVKVNWDGTNCTCSGCKCVS
jgi:hypothetical protein